MPNYQQPDNNGYETLHKFGRNVDVDGAEDIWDGGGDYPFPAAAAATSIVSDNAADTSGGTGARTVEVIGVDSNYMALSEIATLNGVTPVALTNQFLRVHRMKVLTAGSGGTNTGNIQVKHSSTVLAQITAAMGQTLMAIYTIPADYKAGWLAKVTVSVGRAITSIAEMYLQVRDFGGAWRTLDTFHVSNAMDGSVEYVSWLKLNPKTDIRLRCASVSASNTIIHGCFDIVLAR